MTKYKYSRADRKRVIKNALRKKNYVIPSLKKIQKYSHGRATSRRQCGPRVRGSPIKSSVTITTAADYETSTGRRRKRKNTKRDRSFSGAIRARFGPAGRFDARMPVDRPPRNNNNNNNIIMIGNIKIFVLGDSRPSRYCNTVRVCRV